MRKDDAIRLRHMLDASMEILSFVQGIERSSLDTDRKLSLALIRSVEVVGEAASKISQECREEFPNMPWASMVAMRNRLIHAYFEIDLDVLWETITEDIPSLVAELEKITPLD